MAWQKCPVCNGTGKNYGGLQTSAICPTCIQIILKKPTAITKTNKPMAKTAVEWLNHELWSLRLQLRGGEISIEDFGKKMVVRLEQAKQMEREQHNNSWVDGNNTQRCNSTKETNDCFDNYYNETYGK